MTTSLSKAANEIRIVAALAKDEDGRVLLVRKRGTSAFMQPGGKLDAGEDPRTGLAREILEELKCGIDLSICEQLGQFRAPAANEPDCEVVADLYAVSLIGEPRPRAEIDEAIWIQPHGPFSVPLAPLTEHHVLPLARKNPQ